MSPCPVISDQLRSPGLAKRTVTGLSARPEETQTEY